MFSKILLVLLLLLTTCFMLSNARTESFYVDPKLYLTFSFRNSSFEPSELKVTKNVTLTAGGQAAVIHHAIANYSGLYHYIKLFGSLNTTKFSKEPKTEHNEEVLIKIIYSYFIVPETELLPFQCPDAKAIAPCTCLTTDQSLNCSAVNSFIQLKQILNTADFPSKKFEKFDYYSRNANEEEATLLNNTFGPLSFIRILIGDSGLVEVEAQALSGSEDTLKYFLSDNNNQLSTFPFQHILNNFKNLFLLYLIKGSIINVPQLSSTSLQYLDMNTNKISKIEYDTFQNLPSLHTLDLSYNSIGKIGPTGWSISSNCNIYINHNKLTDASPFTNFQPSILDESSNFLTSFQQEVYKPILDGMHYVDVSSNNISCTEMRWATTEPSYMPYLVSDCTEG